MFRCKVCGWLHAGDVPPDTCPSCGSPADRFRPVATGLGPAPASFEGLTPGARIRLLALVPATIDSPFTRHDGPRLDVVTGDGAWFDDNIPCMRACPVNTDAASYIGHVAGGAFGLAALINQEQNVFAGTLGRTCSRPCEDACRRTVIDSPIQIRALKRVATDHSDASSTPARVTSAPSTGRRIGIVGSGVAGLTVARELRRAGNDVTIFERDDVPGGLMNSGVPAWRLPRDVVATDISGVTALGITIQTGRELGRDVSVADLSSGFDAVVIATGAQAVATMPGTTTMAASAHEPLSGVIDGLSFLRHVAAGGQRPAGPIVVIGGGYTAFDCARTARRLASGAVTIVMRQTTPASIAADELVEAKAEGVAVRSAVSFIGVTSSAGTVDGVALQDDTGARQTIPCSLVIGAIGQEPDWNVIDLPTDSPILADTALADAGGRVTSWPNVWLAGDVVDGPTSFIDAIASGNRTASAVEQWLERDGPFVVGTTGVEAGSVELKLDEIPASNRSSSDLTMADWTRDLLYRRVIEHEPYREIAPQLTRMVAPANRALESGDPAVEVDLGMTAEIGQAEAARCLQCQANIAIDADRCILCNGCVDVCPYGCIEMLGLGRLASIDGEPLDRVDGLNRQTVAMLIDEDSCIRCGKCVDWCPTSCLTMNAHRPTLGGQPEPFDIRSLLARD